MTFKIGSHIAHFGYEIFGLESTWNLFKAFSGA
jgi:hypothetical protein